MRRPGATYLLKCAALHSSLFGLNLLPANDSSTSEQTLTL